MTKEELIAKYYPAAISATKGSGIFPQTLLSQLILESGYNLSQLAIAYNNFFGIKATSKFSGKVVSKNTYEYTANGSPYLVTGTNKLYPTYTAAVNDGANKVSLFRTYPTATIGFKDYVNFLQVNPRYKKVFVVKTPEEQFKELQAAGYATSNTYASQLLAVYNSIKKYLPNIKTVAVIGASGIIIIGAIYLIYRSNS